jgi:hypothetical protein
MLTAVGLPLLLLLTAAAPGPCDLLSKSDASALLGQPVTAVDHVGPQPDEDTGGTLDYCVYRTATSAMTVSEVVFPSAAAAKKAVTQEFLLGQMDAEDASVEAESGIGEQGWWGHSGKGAQYVVIKGATVLAVGLGGQGIKDPASHKAALRAAIISAAGKL